MTNENIDPVYAHIDKKIKALKKEFSKRFEESDVLGLQEQLIKLDERLTAFSKEFSEKIQQYEHELLGFEQYVCAAHVNEDVDTFCDLLDSSKIRNKSELRTQLIADGAGVKGEIFASKRPQRIAVDFHQKWGQFLKDNGVIFIQF